MGDLLAARILGSLGRRLLGGGAGLLGRVGSKAARDRFLDWAAGYQRPPQPVQHGAGVLRALIEAIQPVPRDSVIGGVKDAIIARRGKEARNIAKVAAARRLLTLVFYGMRDGQIRCLARPPAGPAATQPAQAA